MAFFSYFQTCYCWSKLLIEGPQFNSRFCTWARKNGVEVWVHAHSVSSGVMDDQNVSWIKSCFFSHGNSKNFFYYYIQPIIFFLNLDFFNETIFGQQTWHSFHIIYFLYFKWNKIQTFKVWVMLVKINFWNKQQ